MEAPKSSAKLVTVFGGSGFVGRYVVQALARRGHRIRVAVRRPDLAGHLQPLGMVGQIKPIQANLRYRWSVDRALEGADAVVNLVGILAEGGRQTFDAVQASGRAPSARRRARRASHASSTSRRSAPTSLPPSATSAPRRRARPASARRCRRRSIMRPSIVFGPEDDFFNRFAAMARMSPALPLIGGGKTRFQPVFAGDVGEAIARAVDGGARPGTIYELGGPEVLTFRECLERMLDVTKRKRLLLPVPWFAARIMGRVGQHLPGAPMTLDQVRMLTFDNVVSQDAERDKRTLEGLGIEPTALEIVLPTYLERFRERGEFAPANAA